MSSAYQDRKFLSLWANFDHGFRQLLPPKKGPAYYWKKEYLESVSVEAAELWESLTASVTN